MYLLLSSSAFHPCLIDVLESIASSSLMPADILAQLIYYRFYHAFYTAMICILSLAFLYLMRHLCLYFLYQVRQTIIKLITDIALKVFIHTFSKWLQCTCVTLRYIVKYRTACNKCIPELCVRWSLHTLSSINNMYEV